MTKVCPHCGGEVSVEHPTTRSSRQLRQARRQAGLCASCGKPSTRYRCTQCRDTERIKAHARRT